MKMSRLVLVVALAVAVSGCSDSGGTGMNVILVTLDTTRADYLGAYGRPEGWTPNFDRVARRGTRFDLAVATAAVTPVSHASILTGRNNSEHGLRVLYAAGGYRLPADVPTLATTLKEEGYHTGAVHAAFPVDLASNLPLCFLRTRSAGRPAHFHRRKSKPLVRHLACRCPSGTSGPCGCRPREESHRPPVGFWQ